MDLTLIEKIEICGTDTYFYDGIDFDMISGIRFKKYVYQYVTDEEDSE